MPRSVHHQAHIITVLNRKSGVGKTHLCWLLASVCEERGKRCLVIDLDPQANFTGSFLEGEVERTVETLFDPAAEPDIESLIQKTAFPGIDVVPSSPRLEPFNVTDEAVWKKADLHLSLAETLPQIADEYDFIVCDCPPSLSLVSYAALSASDFCLIPLEAARWGALGTQQIVSAVDYVAGEWNERLSLLGYVVSRFKVRRSYQQTYHEQLRSHFGDLAFKTAIPDLAAFEKAVTDHTPITLHSPSSHASSIARQFFDEIEARCQKSQSGPIGKRRIPIQAVPAT